MEAIVKPKGLKAGDRIGIISPSSLVTSKEELERGMQTLRIFGLRSELSKNAMKHRYNFQAGTPKQRLADLHEMFLDPKIRGIFCSTGGYSAIELLSEGIDWDIIRKNPKVFVGYSDITTLLNPIYEKTGLVTFHGPIVEGLNSVHSRQGKYTLSNMVNAVMYGKTGKMTPFTEWKVLKEGVVEGILVGGNLNVLLSLIGTPFEPNWDGKILFWEEVDDTIEGFNHYMTRMRVAGIFQKISGMVVGKITNLQSIDDENENPKGFENSPLVEKIILNATRGYDFPILYGVDFGHGIPSLTLPIGARAKLNCPVTERVGSLSLMESYLS